MTAENPQVQIWNAECNTRKERDEIVQRCKQINDCTILFTGRNDEEKYVVIVSLVGEATNTPAVDLFGHKTYPEGPALEMLIGFAIITKVTIKLSPT